MKIEKIESLLRGGAHFVRVTSDDGTTGIGQSGNWAYPDATHAIVLEAEKYLLGQNPFHIERHWYHLYRMGPFRGSVLSAAVSAIDIALWDLKGKAIGVPVYELLGGAFRDRIRLMRLITTDPADDLLYRQVSDALADGYTAVKVSPVPRNHFDLSSSAVVARTRECVAEVRSMLGRDVDLIIELGRRLTPTLAYQVLGAIEEFSPLFVEDPIQIDSVSLQAEIARRFPSVPVGNGERLNSVWEFGDLLESGGPQFLRPDIGLAGGISGARKIAALAESKHSAVVFHNFLGPVLTAASLHVDAVVPNFLVQEYFPKTEEERVSGYRVEHVRSGGWIELSEASGLGVDVDVDALPADVRPDSTPVHAMPRGRDGGPSRHW